MMDVRGRWVEGHTGDEWNERCDKLAGLARKKAMGIEPKKKGPSKATLMLQTIKEIAKLAEKNSDPKVYLTANFTDWAIVKEYCDEVLGNK